MDIDYLLTCTRAVRKSLDLDAPIDQDVLRDCLRVACQAANGSNKQSWQWIVVQDPELRAQVGRLYSDAYIDLTGRQAGGDWSAMPKAEGRLMTSVEWLVQHIAQVPVIVIPCVESYLPSREGGGPFETATLYGSIFPAVWNFQLALHSRGYGSCITTLHLNREKEFQELLGIPESFTQGCLLPVGRLPEGKTFKPAPRRPVDEVISVNGWNGHSL